MKRCLSQIILILLILIIFLIALSNAQDISNKGKTKDPVPLQTSTNEISINLEDISTNLKGTGSNSVTLICDNSCKINIAGETILSGSRLSKLIAEFKPFKDKTTNQEKLEPRRIIGIASEDTLVKVGLNDISIKKGHELVINFDELGQESISVRPDKTELTLDKTTGKEQEQKGSCLRLKDSRNVCGSFEIKLKGGLPNDILLRTTDSYYEFFDKENPNNKLRMFGDNLKLKFGDECILNENCMNIRGENQFDIQGDIQIKGVTSKDYSMVFKEGRLVKYTLPKDITEIPNVEFTWNDNDEKHYIRTDHKVYKFSWGKIIKGNYEELGKLSKDLGLELPHLPKSLDEIKELETNIEILLSTKNIVKNDDSKNALEQLYDETLQKLESKKLDLDQNMRFHTVILGGLMPDSLEKYRELAYQRKISETASLSNILEYDIITAIGATRKIRALGISNKFEPLEEGDSRFHDSKDPQYLQEKLMLLTKVDINSLNDKDSFYYYQTYLETIKKLSNSELKKISNYETRDIFDSSKNPELIEALLAEHTTPYIKLTGSGLEYGWNPGRIELISNLQQDSSGLLSELQKIEEAMQDNGWNLEDLKNRNKLNGESYGAYTQRTTLSKRFDELNFKFAGIQEQTAKVLPDERSLDEKARVFLIGMLTPSEYDIVPIAGNIAGNILRRIGGLFKGNDEAVLAKNAIKSFLNPTIQKSINPTELRAAVTEVMGLSEEAALRLKLIQSLESKSDIALALQFNGFIMKENGENLGLLRIASQEDIEKLSNLPNVKLLPGGIATISGRRFILSVEGSVPSFKENEIFISQSRLKELQNGMQEQLISLKVEEIASRGIPKPFADEAIRGSYAIAGEGETISLRNFDIESENFVHGILESYKHDPLILDKANMKEALLARAMTDGIEGDELKYIERTFEDAYQRIDDSLSDVPLFVEELGRLEKKDPGFTNVHLVRDGIPIGQADIAYQKAMGIEDPEVAFLYESRDTISGGSISKGVADKTYGKILNIFNSAANEGSAEAFYSTYFKNFEHSLANDDEFREMVENSYYRLQKSGLLKKDKLRFVDSCCTGSINLYLEAIVKHYRPDIKTQSFLMLGGNPWISASLRGRIIEGVEKKGIFGGFDENGMPLLKPGTENPSELNPKISTSLSYLTDMQSVGSTIKYFEERGKLTYFGKSITDISRYKSEGQLTGAIISTHPTEVYSLNGMAATRIFVKSGPEHTLRSELLSQRVYSLLGLPVARTSLVRDKDELKLASEYLSGYSAGAESLPKAFQEDRDIQKGLLASLLTYDYDRTPWNFMFKGDDVKFVDFGASFGSRARGGYKGFPDSIDASQIRDIMTNPQYGGAVNEAYLKALRNRDLIRQSARSMSQQITNSRIDSIVDEAFEGVSIKESRSRLTTWISELEQDPDSKSQSAVKMYKRILEEFNGDEGAYYKYALKNRRDQIVAQFSR